MVINFLSINVYSRYLRFLVLFKKSRITIMTVFLLRSPFHILFVYSLFENCGLVLIEITFFHRVVVYGLRPFYPLRKLLSFFFVIVKIANRFSMTWRKSAMACFLRNKPLYNFGFERMLDQLFKRRRVLTVKFIIRVRIYFRVISLKAVFSVSFCFNCWKGFRSFFSAYLRDFAL